MNALVGYMAMPKNQNLGLGRILAGTAQAGMQGAQGVYSGALEDYMTQQKVAEMKRKADQQKQLETMISGLSPDEQVLARLAPEQFVANIMKPKERKTATVNGSLYDVTDPTNPTLIVKSTEMKANPQRERQVGRTKIVETMIAPPSAQYPEGQWKEISRGSMDAPEKQSWEVKVGMDGKTYYVPKNPSLGSTVLDAQGRPTNAYAPKPEATADMLKAQGFLKRIEGTNKVFDANVKDKSGKILGSAIDVYGTPPTYLQTLQTMSDKVPFSGDAQLAAMRNLPAPQQAVENAKVVWVMSVLRPESGAVISAPEISKYVQTYFPIAGESAEGRRMKANLRKDVESGLKIQAGTYRSGADMESQYGG
jgi:hypothetical protein